MNAATRRNLKIETEAVIKVQSWMVSRAVGTKLEVAISATLIELQIVADGVIELLSVKLAVVRAAVA